MTDEERNDPLVGTIEHGGFISEQPPDVEEFLTDLGIADKAYVFTLKRAPREGSAAKEFLPVNLKGTYLPIDECGKRFGPGQYFFCFSWMANDPEKPGKSKKVFKEYKIYLGTEWGELYDEYQASKYMQGQKKLENMAMKKKMMDAAKGILPNDKKSERNDPIEDMKKTMEVMKGLGVPIGAPVPTTNDQTGMMAMMMNMQNENAKTNMQMFMTMNANMMQLVTAMIAGNKPQSNNDMMKEVLNMVNSAVNLKEVLNPEKETVVDKVFALAQSVMPAIVAIAAKPKAERANDPLVGVVKGSDDFDKIRNDPDMLNALIKKWDDTHGARKTDIILETVGLSRPGGPAPTEEPVEENESEAEYTPVNDAVDENVNPME